MDIFVKKKKVIITFILNQYYQEVNVSINNRTIDTCLKSRKTGSTQRVRVKMVRKLCVQMIPHTLSLIAEPSTLHRNFYLNSLIISLWQISKVVTILHSLSPSRGGTFPPFFECGLGLVAYTGYRHISKCGVRRGLTGRYLFTGAYPPLLLSGTLRLCEEP